MKLQLCKTGAISDDSKDKVQNYKNSLKEKQLTRAILLNLIRVFSLQF